MDQDRAIANNAAAHITRCAAGLLLVLAVMGCGGTESSPGPATPVAKTVRPAAKPTPSPRETASQPSPARKHEPLGPKSKSSSQKPEEERPPKRFPPGSSSRTLADDLRAAEEEEEALRGTRPQLARPRKLDDDRLRAAGLRKLTGKHVTLYTDLPSSPAIDELPEVWDQAYPQWCEFFRVDRDQAPPWHMRGFLMGEGSRRKFHDLDLIPPPVPDFQAGYSYNYEFWMYEQQSDYYRRHLLLHEGTHGFMWTLMGPCTSSWYAEATAELLGTHLWENRKLTLRQFPRSREETAYHGRIKLVKECFAERRAVELSAVVSSPFDLHGGAAADKERQEGYAWSWASATFLDGHSRYRERFRVLCSKMRSRGAVPGQFRLWYERDWEDLMEEWQVFVSGLEYRYDLERNEIAFSRGTPLAAGGRTVAVQADRGWQSAEVAILAGKTYDLSASGRIVLVQKPKPWKSEADGITIRYHHGLPLGTLLAAVRVEQEEKDRLRALAQREGAKLSPAEAAALGSSGFLRPIAVGRSAKITSPLPGTLYLKINDSAAELADNAGKFQVQVKSAVEEKAK